MMVRTRDFEPGKRADQFDRVARIVAVAAVLLIAALAGTGCGDDDDENANVIDQGFAYAMVPHHESAVEMSKIAKDRAQHDEIGDLADRIYATQTSEIATLNAISDRIGKPEGADNGHMMGDGSMMGGYMMPGMNMNSMGMNGNPDELKSARPFDRAFIDMMIPHHQGAIRMAQMQIRRGNDPELTALSKAIVVAQSDEIEQMNKWRKRWYGSTSPAGGVPGPGGASGHMGSGTGMM